MVAAPSARSRTSTPGPSQQLTRLRGKQPNQRAQSSRSSKASDLSLSEPEAENMPQRANQAQLCQGMPIPAWRRQMKNLRPEEKAIRLKQYELLEQGKEAFGVPPDHDNVEFAKRGLVKARAAARRSFFEGGNPSALSML